MAFEKHSINDSAWGSYKRISKTDTQHPPVTARLTDIREFAGSPVVTDFVEDHFANLILGDTRKYSSETTVTSVTVTSTSSTILAANSNRKSYSIYCPANGVFIHTGDAAATITNSEPLPNTEDGDPGPYRPVTVWTGAIKAITTSDSVVLSITEHTISGIIPVTTTSTSTTSTSTTSTSTSTTSTTSTSTTSTTSTSTTIASTTCDPGGLGLLDHYSGVDCCGGNVKLYDGSDILALASYPVIVDYYDNASASMECATIANDTTVELCEEAGNGEIMSDGYTDCAECIEMNVITCP